METIEYRDVHDKSDWGPGPWQDEPDKKQWRDEATRLPCLIVRNHSGALCGYVGVPKEHPLHGKGYDAPEVDCHGGLTFANGCVHGDNPARGVCHIPGAGEPDDVWWFGFDCAHAWDVWPAFEARNRGRFSPDPDDVYRDFDYVTRQVTSLAAQLAAPPQEIIDQLKRKNPQNA